MPLGNFRIGNPPPNFQNANSFGQPNWLNTGKTVLRGIQQVMPYLSQAGVQFPPVVNFLMKGMGAGGFGAGLGGSLSKPSGIDGQGFLKQGVQQQQIGPNQQGYPQQGYPQQSFPQQGVPQQGYPSQGFFSQGFPPQTYQQQGGTLNNTLNVQSQPPQFSSQPYQPSYQPQAQVLQQQSPKGGIKGLISRFMARRKS